MEANLDAAQPYLALEHVDGCRLDAWYNGQKDRSLRDRLAALHAVASTVADLHGQGIVHRDLKPANILVGPGVRPQLIDFGIAVDLRAQTGGGSVVSQGCTYTLGYAPPEQVAGAPAAPACDVHALGVLLCEALTNRPLVAEARRAAEPAALFSDDAPVVIGMRLREAVVSGPFPRGLVELARRAMDANPAARYRGAGEFAQALLLQMASA